MTSTMVRSRRRRRRPVRSPLKALLAAILALSLIAVGTYYVFFYPEKVESVVYPLEYVDYINEYSARYSLDPARVAAVVYCESSFRPEAVSSAGAIGLMQIMPSTGEWIAQKLDIEGYSDKMLTDPETNIGIGCWYLAYLDKRFDYDITKSTAAYHAGGGAVDKWLTDPENSPDGVMLKNIPSKVTGNYVSKVVAAIDKYKEIISA